jgi:hypothetical protein
MTERECSNEQAFITTEGANPWCEQLPARGETLLGAFLYLFLLDEAEGIVARPGN